MKIDRRKAARWPCASGEGDTIWMGAADASGLVVSYIQSLYWEFGSGCVLPATGVLMQNRGASFSLSAAHSIRSRPAGCRSTRSIPALAVLKDGRIMAYGTMGGDGQPQTQAALFTRQSCSASRSTARSIAPRWLLGRTWGSTHTKLRLESRFDGNLIDRLAAAGHDVEVLAEPYSDTMGHAGAVVLHPDGTLRRRATIRAPTAARRGCEMSDRPTKSHLWAALRDNVGAEVGLQPFDRRCFRHHRDRARRDAAHVCGGNAR